MAEQVSRSALLARTKAVRDRTRAIIGPLSADMYIPQSMPDASPVKWHLGHTNWFWETMVLQPYAPDYVPFSEKDYGLVFNSYYVSLGPRFKRDARSLIVTPTVEDVRDYRAYVDRHLRHFLETAEMELLEKVASIIEICANHEEQHQELMLTDVKHLLYQNPWKPSYIGRKSGIITSPAPPIWGKAFEAAVYDVGASTNGFSFDNERPRHKEYVSAFMLATRPVTNGEYLAFMNDGGYQRQELWLSDGWNAKEAEGWSAPLYWDKNQDGDWTIFSLSGVRTFERHDPVAHVSFYEADAYARWANARLPTEAEWEVAAQSANPLGQFFESQTFHPTRDGKYDSREKNTPDNMFGSVWEWTGSAYLPYPGFTPEKGALGEYNGKFMSGQMVLKGGSCITPEDHIRASYRNFFPPSARWQFSGIRLARTV